MRHPEPVAEFGESFALLSNDGRLRAEMTEIQGAVHVRLYRADEGQCAATGGACAGGARLHDEWDNGKLFTNSQIAESA